jgi:hypothetical protein
MADWAKDGDLLAAARRGSREALGQSLEACRRYLLAIADRQLDQDLQAKGGASDLVQETFLEAQRDFGQFHGPSPDELIRLRERQAATKTPALLISLQPDSGQELFRAGSVLARCATLAANDLRLSNSRRAELANAYAVQAIAMVRESQKKGHREFQSLRKDASFESLRARPDHAALLADLGASATERKP